MNTLICLPKSLSDTKLRKLARENQTELMELIPTITHHITGKFVTMTWREVEDLYTQTLQVLRDNKITTVNDYTKIKYDPHVTQTHIPQNEQLWFHRIVNAHLNQTFYHTNFLISSHPRFGMEGDVIYNVCNPQFYRDIKTLMHRKNP